MKIQEFFQGTFELITAHISHSFQFECFCTYIYLKN
jgi:hypothetical protein